MVEIKDVKGFGKLRYKDLFDILSKIPEQQLNDLVIIRDTYTDDFLFAMNIKKSDSGQLFLEV